MSTETTEHADQTCPGFFKRPRIGDKLRGAWIAFNTTRLANILESIVGTGGIVIHKPRGANGIGWTIDGSGISGGGDLTGFTEREDSVIDIRWNHESSGKIEVLRGTVLVKDDTESEWDELVATEDYSV